MPGIFFVLKEELLLSIMNYKHGIQYVLIISFYCYIIFSWIRFPDLCDTVTQIFSGGERSCILEHNQATRRERTTVSYVELLDLWNYGFSSLYFPCHKRVPRRHIVQEYQKIITCVCFLPPIQKLNPQSWILSWISVISVEHFDSSST